MKQQLKRLKDTPVSSAPIVTITKSQANFVRTRNPDGKDPIIGHFFLKVDIETSDLPIYIPVSIASGKKPAGFVYQIEGTSPGAIHTATMEVAGASAPYITLGTLRFAHIPRKSVASFRVQIDITGAMRSDYHVALILLNYKYRLEDARYTKLPLTLLSKKLVLR
jgi:hypothetical protein